MTNKKLNEVQRKIDVKKMSSTVPVKINFDALSDVEKKNWISFSKPQSAGDITRIRPNYTNDSHLVCHFNPEDELYDLCYPISNGE